jgi:3-hydroxyacyl-[acyl-carrier-protein] dehydratase
VKQDVASALVEIDRRPDADPPTATAQFRFPAALPIFAGHFPGFALVPGIYMVEMARSAAERLLDRRLVLAKVLDARFTAEVFPDTAVTTAVRLRGEDGGWCCEAEIHIGETRAARLRLLLR